MHKSKVRGSLRPPPSLQAAYCASSLHQLSLPCQALAKQNARPFASLGKQGKRSLQKDFSLAVSSPVECCRKSEDVGALKKTLAHLDDPGFSVDFTTYTSLLRFCRKTESLQDGELVHRHITRNGLQHDLRLVSLLVLMYTDCGAMDQAHDVFLGLIVRDEFAFTVILRMYARLDPPCLAFQTFEQMHQEGLVPNNKIFTSIFTACTKQLAFSEGKRMHARFLGTTFCADIATNTALVAMYHRCNNAEYARWIFDNMEELDAVIWNVMIASCVQQKQGKDALELFNSMQHQGVMLSKVTVIHVLDACGSVMDLAKGLQLHCSIMDSEVESDIMVQTALINMYGSCGGVGYAEKLFNKMVSKDEIVWSAMIAVYSQSAQVRSAAHLFERMLQEGMVSNKYILSSVLSGCAEQLVPVEGKQMHARTTHSGLSLDGAVGNALVKFYGKIGCLKDAWKAFHQTIEHDMVSWNAIIAACAEHGHLDGARQTFNELLQQGLLADKAAVVNLLSACANQAALSEGRIIHACISCSELKADLNIENALVNMYGKCGELNFMRTIFEEMLVKNSVSWNTVIGVYAQHGHDEEALQLFEEMQEAGIAPDRLTFTSVLSVCANQGALAEGKRLHEIFKSRGFQPDQVVGSALVSLYGKCGCLTEARDVFASMPECDVVIWNALITAFSQNGQGEVVLELFDCMQQRKIKPTGVTFISVLSACSHVGLVDEAWHHFYTLESCYGITPVVDHYNCMIDLLGRAGRLEEAEQLLSTMSAEPTVASLMTLLGACRNLHDHVRGKRVADKVFKLDPGSPSPYVMLSNIYSLVGKADDAMNVIKEMRDKQINFEPDENLDAFLDQEPNVELFEYHLVSEEDACVG